MSIRANNGEEGGRQSCASCKHQRKKCSGGTCILQPYFPAEKTEDFRIVHKYFGVSNLSKNLKNLISIEERDRAVESYVWAGRAWEQNPAAGPLGLFMDLWQQNQQLEQEIRELKSGANYGAVNASKYQIGSSIHGNYGALVRAPIQDSTRVQVTNYGVNPQTIGGVANFEAISRNYHQRNGLYNNCKLPILRNRMGEREFAYGPRDIVGTQRRQDTNHGFCTFAQNQ